MLNLIKNIVKFYGNISQIYNNDINKKNIFKSLLNKYNIKEKVKIDLNYISYMHKENNILMILNLNQMVMKLLLKLILILNIE